jgi:hypothetical protein
LVISFGMFDEIMMTKKKLASQHIALPTQYTSQTVTHIAPIAVDPAIYLNIF